MWNLVNYPVMTIPYGVVEKSSNYLSGYTPDDVYQGGVGSFDDLRLVQRVVGVGRRLWNVHHVVANSYGDLQFFFESVLRANPWNYDHTASAVLLSTPAPQKKLTIGVIYEDPHFPVHPPVKKNLYDAVELLRKAGHIVVEISNHPNFDDTWRTAFVQFSVQVEGEKNPLQPFFDAGEPLIESLGQSGIDHYVPKLADTLKEVVGSLRETKKMKEQWHDVFCKNKLDILLAPVAPSTAPPHDTYGIAPYTSMWNLVNYPSLVIPYGITSEDYEEDLSRYPAHLKGIYAHYDNESYRNGIGSVQLIAPNYRDEALLVAGKLVDDALNA